MFPGILAYLLILSHQVRQFFLKKQYKILLYMKIKKCLIELDKLFDETLFFLFNDLFRLDLCKSFTIIGVLNDNSRLVSFFLQRQE